MLFVTVGELDALFVASHGYAVVGHPGTGSGLARWCVGWSRYDQVIVLMDADGDRSDVGAFETQIRHAARRARFQGVTLERVRFHRIDARGCKDPNDLKQRGLLCAYLERLVQYDRS